MATIEKTLEQARITLSNAANDAQLLAILTQYGYGSERLQAGMALYTAARDSVQTESNAQFSKVNATQSFQQDWKVAKLHYQNDLRLARVALKQHDATHHFLQLNGTRSKPFDAWQGQAKDFYLGLRNQSELQAIVEPIGLTTERIEQGIQHLQRLEVVRLQNQAEKGSVVDTRLQRHDTFQALNRWMFTFRQIARAALAGNPAHLARLALEPESRKQKKKDEVMIVAKPVMEATASLDVAQ